MLSTPILNRISQTLFLDNKNNEDCATGSSDDDDYEYEEPDLSGGVEGVDYGIVYGRGDNTMDTEAEE